MKCFSFLLEQTDTARHVADFHVLVETDGTGLAESVCTPIGITRARETPKQLNRSSACRLVQAARGARVCAQVERLQSGAGGVVRPK